MVREGYWFGLPPLLIGLLLLAIGHGSILAGGVLLVFLGLFVFSFFEIQTELFPENQG